MKLYVGGAERLTTQLYFEGDPYIPMDTWASDPDAEHRTIALTEDPDGALRGVMVFTL